MNGGGGHTLHFSRDVLMGTCQMSFQISDILSSHYLVTVFTSALEDLLLCLRINRAEYLKLLPYWRRTSDARNLRGFLLWFSHCSSDCTRACSGGSSPNSAAHTGCAPSASSWAAAASRRPCSSCRRSSGPPSPWRGTQPWSRVWPAAGGGQLLRCLLRLEDKGEVLQAERSGNLFSWRGLCWSTWQMFHCRQIIVIIMVVLMVTLAAMAMFGLCSVEAAPSRPLTRRRMLPTNYTGWYWLLEMKT